MSTAMTGFLCGVKALTGIFNLLPLYEVLILHHATCMYPGHNEHQLQSIR